MQTTFDQQVERESHYQQMRALNAVLIELAGFVHIARSVSETDLAMESAIDSAVHSSFVGH